MTQDLDLPPGVEAVLRSALRAAFDAGRKPGTPEARDTAITYGVDRVAHAWIVGRGQQVAGAA